MRITYTEDTESFSTVSAATLTTFMRMIKSQTLGERMCYTLDFEQLQISIQVLSFLFHSSWWVFRLTQISWRLVWVPVAYSLHFSSTLWLHTQIQMYFGISATDLKRISSFPPQSFFMERSIHHSGSGLKQSNIILNIIYQKLVQLPIKCWPMNNYR